jgi:hypothetical protein
VAKSNSIASALKKAQATWKKAKKRVATEERKSFGSDFADGRYTAKLVNVALGQSDAGRTQSTWQWKFLDGDNEGEIKYDYQGMESEDNLFYFGRRLEDFSYELPDDIADIEEIFRELTKEKPVAKIRLRTKNDFQNVYIDKVFGEDEEPELDSDEDEDEEVEESEEESDDAEETEEEESEEESDDEEEEESDDDEESEESDDEDSDDEDESEEEEEEDDVDEEADLTVGMDVIAEFKNEKKPGKVVEIFETEGKARIRFKDGKTVRVSFEKLELDDTPPEEPKAKSKKTKAPAEPPPAKAKTASKTSKTTTTKKKK